MNYNNCNCTPIKTIYISSITTNATQVILVPSTTITALKLADLNKYKLVIACNLRATANLPVYIQTALGPVPLLCKYAGNNIFPDQLRSRKCYTVVYGNNSVLSSVGQFVLQNCVCPTRGRGTTGSTTDTPNEPEPQSSDVVIADTTKAKKVNE